MVLTIEAWEALTLQEQQVTWAGLYAMVFLHSSNKHGPAGVDLPVHISARHSQDIQWCCLLALSQPDYHGCCGIRFRATYMQPNASVLEP
jgi:hypothetical protein